MAPGLTNLALEEVAEPPLQATGIDNLWLLSSGPTPPNPADLLGGRRMDELLAKLAAQADIVLLDAPPVVAAADAAILGAKANGVLLIIQAGRTRRDQSERARELLEQAKARIVGVALTNAPRESGAAEYYG